MVFNGNTAGHQLQSPLVRERKDAVQNDLEKLVLVLGDDFQALGPLVSNFDPLLRDFDKVLLDLAATEVICCELKEKVGQSELQAKCLRQGKKSLELPLLVIYSSQRITEVEALHQAELRRWGEEKKLNDRRVEDMEWKLDQRDVDISRITKMNSELQKQIGAYSEQIQTLKKTKNATRKFSSAVRLVKQQKNADVAQQLIKQLEESSEVYSDRFQSMDIENSSLARQLEEAHDMIEEMTRRAEMMQIEKREWKLVREDMMEESTHLSTQLKLLEAELEKSSRATKSLQSQIRKAEADMVTVEDNFKKERDEKQFLKSQIVHMKKVMVSEGVRVEAYPELNVKLCQDIVQTSTPLKVNGSTRSLLDNTSIHELSLHDELELEGDLSWPKSRNSSSEGDLESRNTQLEHELLRMETEKNALLNDVHTAEKRLVASDREMVRLKDDIRTLAAQLNQHKEELEAYEQQRCYMEDEQVKMAEKVVRGSRKQRSLKRSDSAISEVDSDNDTLFDENMQLIREKQTLFLKYSTLQEEYRGIEKDLTTIKADSERTIRHLQIDYDHVYQRERSISDDLIKTRTELEKLKCIYNLLTSDNEDPQELVDRLRYKRGEVESLLKERKNMRTQIVGLQKILNLREAEETNKKNYNTGIISRLMGAIVSRKKSRPDMSALSNVATCTSGVVGKDLGYSLVDRGSKRRPSLSSLTGNNKSFDGLRTLPRRISDGWTYTATGCFAQGIPPSVPIYSRLMILDERPQKVICGCFVPHWPFPRLSGVKVLLHNHSSTSSDARSISSSFNGRGDSSKSNKSSFEGRDSSAKSKDSSSRGSCRSMESKASIRSTQSVDGKSHFPNVEQLVTETENVAVSMLCLSSVKPLSCMALNSHVVNRLSTQVEDRISATMFSQDLTSPVADIAQAEENYVHQNESIEEHVEEEVAHVKRELFRQTKEAFLRKPASSFRHKVSGSQSLYPFLWVITVDEGRLSFLHIINLNFPARITKTHFLCEGKVQAMCVITNDKGKEEEKIEAKKVLYHQSGELSSCWMGTEDGRLFILKLREPHEQAYSRKLSDSAIVKILFEEPYVYVALKNGALVTFCRTKEGAWDLDNYHITVIDTPGRKVRALTVVDNRVWCGAGPTLSIFSPQTFQVQDKVTIVMDNKGKIKEMIQAAGTIWISLQNSMKVVILAMDTREILRVIALKGYLMRIGRRHGLDLTSIDLYITTMFYDGGLIWIGTNIGVILSVVFPGKSGTKGSLLSSTDDAWQSGSFDIPDKPVNQDAAKPAIPTNDSAELDNLAIVQTDESENHDITQEHVKKQANKVLEQSTNHLDLYNTPGVDSKSDGFNNKENGRKSVVDREKEEEGVKHTQHSKDASFEYINVEDIVNPSKEMSSASYSSLGLLGREATFDYIEEEGGGEAADDETDTKTDISEEIDEMLASFNNITNNIRKQVEGITEDSILFSMYGNQGPVHSFCRVQGDGDLSSLLCAGGIGFDSFEVKGLKTMRRKDVINASSPNDTCLLSQLLMWSYCRRHEEEK